MLAVPEPDPSHWPSGMAVIASVSGTILEDVWRDWYD